MRLICFMLITVLICTAKSDKKSNIDKIKDVVRKVNETIEIGKEAIELAKELQPYAEKSYELFKKITKTELSKEWSAKLGKGFTKIASASSKISKYAGPAGEIASMIFVILGEEAGDSKTIEYLKEITEKLDKVDAKLESIGEQLAFLEAKQSQSTQKILAETKFQGFVKLIGELTASKQTFEKIVYGFDSDVPKFICELDQLILNYENKGSDTQLVELLGQGSGIITPIIDDLITVSRSYHDKHFGSSGSSTMKTVYDVYLAAFMSILKGNVILESAVNLKSSLTGEQYGSDRLKIQYHKQSLFKKLFENFEDSFRKLKNQDENGFIDLSINGEHKSVRMLNVLQIFWENEDKLSIIDTCTDDCEHFVNRKYNGDGCYGAVRDCKFGVSVHYTEKQLRQNPQKDRIYLGYNFNNKWYGLGENYDKHPNMQTRKSYLRGFVNCHVCNCTCDQYSHSNTIRKIYAGIVSAPDGFVVTGIRLVMHNKAIYPQIEIGRLLPLATVDQKSVQWMDIPNDNQFVSMNYDIHHLRVGDIEDLKFDDSLVTGVQFQEKLFGVSWKIYGRKFVDYNIGILGEEVSIASRDDRSNYFDGGSKKPGISNQNRPFTIRKDMTIKFWMSDVESDAGQSFIPYFDGNDITFVIKSPLSGISLIQYSNDEQYAGYIRPVISTLNYRKYVEEFNNYFSSPYFEKNEEIVITNKNGAQLKRAKSDSIAKSPLKLLYVLSASIVVYFIIFTRI